MVQSHSPAELTAVQRLCRMAVLAAVVFVMTMVPKIPIPLGYANLGEAAILLIALGFPRRDAALAAGLGSALTDLLGGYAVWAVPTFIIKGFMAFVVTLTSGGRTFSDGGLSTGRILLSFFVGFDVGRGGLHSGGGRALRKPRRRTDVHAGAGR